MESYLLNGSKSNRHALRDEALTKEDAKKYIIKCILDGDIYLQTDNNNLLYLYQVEENKYLQIAVKPLEKKSSHRSSLTIPLVKNIQFINENQKKSKFEANKMATHRAGRRQNKIERLSEPHITIARYVVKCLYLKIFLYFKYSQLFSKSQVLR